jgi:TolB protein
MISDSMIQTGILWLIIVVLPPCEPVRGQSDSPTGTVQAPFTSPTPASNKPGMIPAIRRVTNVMDRYPQVSRDEKILLFDSNRSGTLQIYSCTLENSGAKATDPTAPIYRTENILQLTNLPFPARCPSWSPDMKKIAFAGEPQGHSETFVMDADGSHISQLTHTGGDDSHPHWSADGSRIMFNSSRTTPNPKADWNKQWHELFSMKPDGSDVRQHTHCKTVCTYGSFSPDMKKITYRKVTETPGVEWDLTSSKRNSEVFVADADGSNVINLSQNAAFDGWPMWSPDGKTIAFSSNRSGPANVGQIYLINPDGSELRQLTTGSRSFAQPSWSADGRRIFVYENCETADYEYGNISVITVPQT